MGRKYPSTMCRMQLEGYEYHQGQGAIQVRRVKAMNRLAYRKPPKFKMSEVKEFQKYLREQIKIQQKRLGEI
jgi:hypothetical protein